MLLLEGMSWVSLHINFNQFELNDFTLVVLLRKLIVAQGIVLIILKH